jgi:exopolysaccharide/PEP-CTERM locus tyrosine autokinase
MNKHSPLQDRGSLLERAAALYDFDAVLRAPPAAPVEVPASRPVEPVAEAKPKPAPAPRQPRPARVDAKGAVAAIDRARLAEAGFIVPDAPVSQLAEEFRIVKRQLLAGTLASDLADDKRQTILVCSATPDEGKTFCAINLALSLASERDMEVLLVDGDFAKPEILSILGVEGGPGLVDALCDPLMDPESLVIRTDIDGFSVMPAGRHANDIAELLASERTRDLLVRLGEANRRRLVIFDSPPALLASPASVLAGQVGQLLMVVRADSTTESDLSEALGLLSGCENISLMLNGAGFAGTSRRFGSYYGLAQ